MAEVVTVESNEHFEDLLSTDPKMRAKLKKVLSSVLQKARKQVSNDAKSVLNNDPRQAYRAVKRAVYKRMLGGNISILQPKKASAYRASVTHTQNRGRMQHTQQIDSYWGADRGFILRFVNAGTDDRFTKNMNGHSIQREERMGKRAGGYKSPTIGYRGRIGARNWFGASSQRAMELAAQVFCNMIDEEIYKMNV